MNGDVLEIMKYPELSSYLGRSIGSLKADVTKQKIPFIKLGDGKRAQIIFRKKDIDAWLDRIMQPAIMLEESK
jgi:hypothetical protein